MQNETNALLYGINKKFRILNTNGILNLNQQMNFPYLSYSIIDYKIQDVLICHFSRSYLIDIY